MGNALLLRDFGIADIESARALWARIPGVGLSSADEPAALAEFLRRNPGTSFVAEEGATLVGTILCGHDGRRGLIHHLAVEPDRTRRGLGRGLLRRGLAALQECGIQKCHFLVFKDNAAGVAFWRAVGASERVELSLFSLATANGA